jgi:hypothetical protein
MPPSQMLRRAFLVPASPVPLAVTRIVFFGLAFTASTTRLPAEMADLPDGLVESPTGSAWLYSVLPPDATLARLGGLVMVVAALAAAVGYRARLAAAVWCGLGIWVWGIPNLFGKVDHNHHMLWFAALLAASPCADVLAPGSGRRARVDASVRYGFPIRVWWALIAVIYLFAGVPKLLNDGPGWASPENLRPLLHMQWAVVDGFEPLFRVDRYPLLLWAIGLGTLLFELAFVALVFTRARPFAVAAGVVFHLSTYALLDISFTSLLVSYVAFLPWDAAGSLTTDQDRRPGATPDSTVPERRTVAVAGVLLAGAVLFGAANVVDGWPFASYPAFAGRFPDARTELEFELVLEDGSVQRSTIDEVFSWVPSSRRARIAGQLLELGPAAQRLVLSELELATPAGATATRLLVRQVVVATDPDEPRVLDREVVLDVTLDPSS